LDDAVAVTDKQVLVERDARQEGSRPGRIDACQPVPIVEAQVRGAGEPERPRNLVHERFIQRVQISGAHRSPLTGGGRTSRLGEDPVVVATQGRYRGRRGRAAVPPYEPRSKDAAQHGVLMGVPMCPQLRDVGFVTEWLNARKQHLDPDARSVRVDAVTQLSRGVARETWAIDGSVVTARSTTPIELAVRRDHEAGSVIPSELRLEFEVYRRLTGTQVPVAAALWFEDDTSLQPDGRPAYVRRRVHGDWYLPFLADTSAASDALRIAACKEHLEKLALVHTLDWQ